MLVIRAGIHKILTSDQTVSSLFALTFWQATIVRKFRNIYHSNTTCTYYSSTADYGINIKQKVHLKMIFINQKAGQVLIFVKTVYQFYSNYTKHQ